VGDRAGPAVTLNNIGEVYRTQGEPQQALAYFERALPLSEVVGDRRQQSITLGNIAVVYHAQGNLAEAVRLLERAVALEEALGHPSLARDRAVLERWRARLAAQAQE
jgi:Tfp pilus assembly protein PilF